MGEFTKLVHYPSPEAEFLEDLSGILTDLRQAKSYVDQIVSTGNAESHSKSHTLQREALGEAAVIRYGRCFATGVRDSIPNALFQDAPKKLQKNHEYFILLRNRYIAHSVANFEQVAVVIQLEKVRGRYQVWDVGEVTARSGPFGRLTYYSLLELIDWLVPVVELIAERERQAIFEQAVQLGPKVLQSFGIPKTIFKALGKVSHKPRKSRKRGDA